MWRGHVLFTSVSLHGERERKSTFERKRS